MEDTQVDEARAAARMLRTGPVPFSSPQQPAALEALRTVLDQARAELARNQREDRETVDEFEQRLELARYMIQDCERQIPLLEVDVIEAELHRFTVSDHWELNAFEVERQLDCKESSLLARTRYLGACRTRYFAHQVLRTPKTGGKVRSVPSELVPRMDIGLANAVYEAHVEAFGNPFEPVPKAKATR